DSRVPPAFVLTDQTGHEFSLAAERGRVVLLTFMDSHCRNLCTLESGMLSATAADLGPNIRPELMVVSVNPADTRASVQTFLTRTGGMAFPWHWLTGGEIQLSRVWHAYGIYARSKTTGAIVHSSALYVIDQSGNERAGL